MKKDQNLPNKNIHSNNNSGKPLPINSKYSKTNHLIIPTTEYDHQTKEKHVVFCKTDIVDQIVEIISVETTIHDQFQTDQNFRLIPFSIHTLGIDTIPMIDQEILRTIEVEIIPTIGIEATQIMKF